MRREGWEGENKEVLGHRIEVIITCPTSSGPHTQRTTHPSAEKLFHSYSMLLYSCIEVHIHSLMTR